MNGGTSMSKFFRNFASGLRTLEKFLPLMRAITKRDLTVVTLAVGLIASIVSPVVVGNAPDVGNSVVANPGDNGV